MAEASLSRRGFFGHCAGAYAATGILGGASVVAFDPMKALLNEIYAGRARAGSLIGAERDAYYEHVAGPLDQKLFTTPPQVTSIDGAAAAIRHVLDYDDMEDADAAVLRSVLIFLEAQAVR